MAIGIGSSLSEDWSTRDDQITEVFLVYHDTKLLGIFTPAVYRSRVERRVKCFPAYRVEIVELNTRSALSGL